MNILIFSPISIYPADAGSRVRIYNVINYFIKQGHEVHYLYYTDDGISKVHFEYMLDICTSFSVVQREKKIIRRTGNYELDEWYEDSINIKVLELIEIFNIDTVFMNYMFYSKVFEFLPKNIYKIIDTLDKFTDRYKLFQNVDDVEYDWHSYTKEDETKALNRADMVLAITDEEKNYFLSICNKNIDILTLGHIENKRYIKKSYNKLKKIGFIGGANKVNIVAINEFLEEFYKSYVNNEDLEIIIAGQICKYIKIKNKNIKLLGLIDNLEDFYNDVDIVINPLMLGTGQKIKSVEALSFGVPIISTKIGFEGINSNNKLHSLDSLEDMVSAIDSIKDDSKQLKQLADNSCKVFNNYCSEITNNLNSIFNRKEYAHTSCEVLLKHKGRIQKETYNVLISTYLKKAKQRNIELREHIDQIKKQDVMINKKDMTMKKQIEQIKKQNMMMEKIVEQIKKQDLMMNKQLNQIEKYNNIIKTIKDITEISFIKNPFKKYKYYKKILEVYYIGSSH